MEGEQELIEITQKAMKVLEAKVRRWRKKNPVWTSPDIAALVQNVADEYLNTMDMELEGRVY